MNNEATTLADLVVKYAGRTPDSFGLDDLPEELRKQIAEGQKRHEQRIRELVGAGQWDRLMGLSDHHGRGSR